MNGFFDLIRVVLFASTVALTPVPINMEPGVLEMELTDSLSAVTEGAALHIDVSNMLPDDKKGISRARGWVKETFPEGAIRATLSDSAQRYEVFLFFTGETAWSEGKVFLILSSGSGIPRKVKFDKVFIETDVGLRGVLLTWKRF